MPKKLHNLCKCNPREIQTIQRVNILCKAVNNHPSNQSGHDTRIWYHKNVNRLLFVLSRPHTTLGSLRSQIFHFTLYPNWEPVHRLESESIVCAYIFSSSGVLERKCFVLHYYTGFQPLMAPTGFKLSRFLKESTPFRNGKSKEELLRNIRRFKLRKAKN